MAKTPSIRVGRTSGQGVSRKSYQTGYGLGNRGSASSEGGIPKPVMPDSYGSKREYSKGSHAKPVKEGAFNVDYGDTLRNGRLKDFSK